jgi:hypothetical protein
MGSGDGMGRMAAAFLTASTASTASTPIERRRQPPGSSRSGIVAQARQRKICACTLHLSRAAAGISIGPACADDEPPGLLVLVLVGLVCFVEDRGLVGVDARGDRSGRLIDDGGCCWFYFILFFAWRRLCVGIALVFCLIQPRQRPATDIKTIDCLSLSIQPRPTSNLHTSSCCSTLRRWIITPSTRYRVPCATRARISTCGPLGLSVPWLPSVRVSPASSIPVPRHNLSSCDPRASSLLRRASKPKPVVSRTQLTSLRTRLPAESRSCQSCFS